MPNRDFKPYLEVAEETIIRFRTDLAGLGVIREALQELASSPRGLDADDETGQSARDAEEMLVVMPGPTGGRRSPEQGLRNGIDKERTARRDLKKTADIQRMIIASIEKEMPDLVAAAREKAQAISRGAVDETGGDAPGTTPVAAQPVEPSGSTVEE